MLNDIDIPVPVDVHVIYTVRGTFGHIWTDDEETAMVAIRNQLSVTVWKRHHVRGWEKQGYSKVQPIFATCYEYKGIL